MTTIVRIRAIASTALPVFSAKQIGTSAGRLRVKTEAFVSMVLLNTTVPVRKASLVDIFILFVAPDYGYAN